MRRHMVASGVCVAIVFAGGVVDWVAGLADPVWWLLVVLAVAGIAAAVRVEVAEHRVSRAARRHPAIVPTSSTPRLFVAPRPVVFDQDVAG